MKNVYKLFFIVLLLPTLSKAQNNFKSGYIVNLKGDTLQGLIDFREWDNNPTEISFKNDAGNTVTHYTAETTKAFGVTGFEYFETYTLPISQEKVDVNLALVKNSDNSAISKTVFLKLLSKGSNVSLYCYTDDIKQRFYIKKGITEPVQELTYKVYYEDNTLKTIRRYRVQLQNIAQQINNNVVNRTIASANYTQTDLVKIVKGLNGNDGGLIITQAGHPGSRIFIGVGGNYGTLQFFGTGGPLPDGIKQRSFTPEVNVGLDLYANRNTQALVFRIEVSAMNSKYEFPQMVNNGITSSLEFKQVTFSFKPQIIYNFYNTDKSKIFISSGANVNSSTYNNIFKYQTNANFTAITTTDQFKDFAKLWVSVPVSIGLVVSNKLEVNVSYVLPASVDDIGNVGNTVNFRSTESFIMQE